MFVPASEAKVSVACPADGTVLNTVASVGRHLEQAHKVPAQTALDVRLGVGELLSRLHGAGLLAGGPPDEVSLAQAKFDAANALLVRALAQHAQERDACVEFPCAMCDSVTRSREGWSAHLRNEHGCTVGLVDNLVYTVDFNESMRQVLHTGLCLACERRFASRELATRHMQQVGHTYIDAKNPRYDRFYMVSYAKQAEAATVGAGAGAGATSSDESWSDFEEASGSVVCLFCVHEYAEVSLCLEHMRSEHAFDLVSALRGREFYNAVKLVNYLRRHGQDAAGVPDCLTDADLVPVLADDQLLMHIDDLLADAS